MAVAMVIGNSPQITASLFAPAATMASVIANEYAEADSELHVSALCLIALVLFVVTFGVNFIARMVVWNTERKLKRTF
jgi:phosphate transport system permease protein